MPEQHDDHVGAWMRATRTIRCLRCCGKLIVQCGKRGGEFYVALLCESGCEPTPREAVAPDAPETARPDRACDAT